MTHYRNGYERLLNEKNYYAALSPQQLNSLRLRLINPNADPEKSEIFSIGITALCSVVNNPITSFYDFRDYKIVFDKIEEKCRLMQGLGYSQELIHVIGSCLSEDETSRPS